MADPYKPILEHLRKGAAAQAKTLSQALLQRQPGDSEAWYLLGLAELTGGAPEAGIKALESAIAISYA